jgi:glycosyltransferase involved in cell wall biosynthesis
MTKPKLAIIANAPSPYRLHQHKRIAHEITEIELHSIFSHEYNVFPWKLDFDPQIHPQIFGPGEYASGRSHPKRFIREWKRGGRIIRWIKAEKPAVVVVIGFADAARVRILSYLHRHQIPHFIFGDSNAHGDRATGFARSFKTFFLTRMIGRASGVVCCATLGDRYFQTYGSKPETTFYVPQEPDYEEIASVSPSEVADAKQRFGLADGRRRIAFSGRLARVKRVDLLIDAFVRIADERPQWDVVLLGSGDLEADLKSRIPERLASRFIWTGFVDEQRRVTAVYKACDVLCLPSIFEPWALVINEAAAAGLAMVSSDVVGAAIEIVRDGQNGFIFRSGDLDALADALLKVTHPDDIDRYKAGSATVLADWRTTTDPVDGYRKLLLSAGLNVTPPPATSTGGPRRTPRAEPTPR